MGFVIYDLRQVPSGVPYWNAWAMIAKKQAQRGADDYNLRPPRSERPPYITGEPASTNYTWGLFEEKDVPYEYYVQRLDRLGPDDEYAPGVFLSLRREAEDLKTRLSTAYAYQRRGEHVPAINHFKKWVVCRRIKTSTTSAPDDAAPRYNDPGVGQFIIWNPVSPLPPKQIYTTREVAEKVAAKMAARSPGDTFYVAYLGSSVTLDPPPPPPPAPTKEQLIDGWRAFATFLRGVATPMATRYVLRVSKGHKPPGGVDAASGEPWNVDDFRGALRLLDDLLPDAAGAYRWFTHGTPVTEHAWLQLTRELVRTDRIERPAYLTGHIVRPRRW